MHRVCNRPFKGPPLRKTHPCIRAQQQVSVSFTYTAATPSCRTWLSRQLLRSLYPRLFTELWSSFFSLPAAPRCIRVCITKLRGMHTHSARHSDKGRKLYSAARMPVAAREANLKLVNGCHNVCVKNNCSVICDMCVCTFVHTHTCTQTSTFQQFYNFVLDSSFSNYVCDWASLNCLRDVNINYTVLTKL